MNTFPLVVAAVVALAVHGIPTAHALIAGAILYLWTVGLDTGMAADRVLEGLASTTLLLALPMVVLAQHLTALVAIERRHGEHHASAGAVGAAAAVASATLALLPPSIPLLLYAIVTETSLVYLFVAGLIPGLALAALQLGVFAVGRRGVFGAATAHPCRALPAVLLPAVVVGAMLAGMQPVEAATLGALYALLHALIARGPLPRPLYHALSEAARESAAIGLTIAAAIGFNTVLGAENVPQALGELFLGLGVTATTFLVLVNLVLLLAACVFEGTAILLVVVPLFVPGAQLLGIDMVHFGVIAVVNVLLGSILPPSGPRLAADAHLMHAPLGAVVRHALPSAAVMLVALVAVSALPEVVLWLPRLLGYPG